MSWGLSQNNQNQNQGQKGMRPMGAMILNHKQRYHQPYNQNYDSDKIHQVLGKHWYNLNADARTNAMGGTQRSIQNQFQFIKDGEGEDEQQQLPPKQSQKKGKQGQNLSSTQTQYRTQNYVAERFMDVTRSQLLKERQEHEKKQSKIHPKKRANCKSQAVHNNWVKNPKYNSQYSNHTQSTMSSPRKPDHFRQASMVNTVYSENGRPTTEKKPGYFTTKTCYRDLTIDNEPKKFSQSVSLNATGMSAAKSVQSRGNKNPFRMSTYDTVFGEPQKRYRDDEEDKDKNSEQARIRAYEESAKNMSLFSYTGCIPKNMNLTYKWNSHQYERDNFMRQAPIWTNSQNQQYENGKKYNRRGLITQEKIRFKNYKKYF